MIDLRNIDPDHRGCTFFCDECEDRYKTNIEIKWRNGFHGIGRVKAFIKRHEHCGEAELDARIDKYAGGTEEEWNQDVKIMKAIYRNSPGILFAEASVKFKELKKDIEEMTSFDERQPCKP